MQMICIPFGWRFCQVHNSYGLVAFPEQNGSQPWERSGVIDSRGPRTQSTAGLRTWPGRLLGLVLALLVVLLPGAGGGSSEAFGLPGRNPRQSTKADAPLASSAPSAMQEVAPPPAVQQLQEALAAREPRLEILAPADDSLLPPGPWTLKLRLHDWPLVDGGPLGLGPHLVVQLDDEPPMPLTSTEITMSALAPGSHRLTVFAAKPWGEAAKNPGSWRQIRLHRTATNPLALPPPGQAQLIAVSPAAVVAAEPVLLDWLLLDAPLQNLRSGDARWRLRITINGDGFVIDHQTPLWLKGWQPGPNAIKLELLDGRGEPLDPPRNSLVREVDLNGTSPAPAWQRDHLSPDELAILLGEVVADPMPAAAREAGSAPGTSTSLISESGNLGPTAVFSAGLGALPGASVTGDQPASTAQAPNQTTPETAIPSPGTASRQTNSSEPPPQTTNPERPETRERSTGQAPPQLSTSPARPDQPQSGERLEPSSDATVSETIETADPQDLSLASPQQGAVTVGSPPLDAPQPAGTQDVPVAPTEPAAPSAMPAQSVTASLRPTDNQRLLPASSITGSAREQVNPDGTMVQPPRRGPLARLQERLLP